MVTKGEIQSIDYQGNTCVVRLPYFESAGIKDNIQATATIGNQPGMYNGYKVGDVVYVAFEDGEANQPVIIGKLFLGSDKERNDPRGVVNAESSIISNNIELPITTKIVYETDGTVAQNGNTRYNSLSDITNELGKLTAQQDKTSYDVTGVITTADMLKSEISAVKAGSGSKNTYAQETKPADETYTALAGSEQEKLTETSSYVGYYILVGGKYEEVTDANKDSLSIYPPYTKAYKLQKLEQGDLWVYTGPDIFEKIGTKEKAADYIGCYVYFNNDDKISSDEPETTSCPDCSKDFYKAAEEHYFELIDASNYASIVTSPQAYKKHLANNATFSYDGEKWNSATSSDVVAYGSAITQTASSVSAKVSKTTTNGASTEFGWQLHEKIDDDESIKGCAKTGDEDGQFTVYSKINYSDTSKKAEIKDVLHINKNGLWVNGNLEVEDSAGQKIFRALPYGDYTDTGKILNYEGNPKVEIGGFTVDKTTLKNDSIGFTVGSNGLSITNSDNDQFSVLSDGTIWGKKLYIEQDEKHEAGSSSYFDGNVCGHQMKVDTVELATTNTDQGETQTKGFRVETYTVTSTETKKDDEIEYITLSFNIDNVQDARTKSGSKYSYSYSDRCVACALVNKSITASLKITFQDTDNKQSTATFSITGKLLGYPYASDGTCTDDQKKYLYNQDTKSFKKKQSDELVRILLSEDNTISYKIKELVQDTDGKYSYDEWSDATEVASLKSIKCQKIIALEVVSWTPKKEEYFTGDFLASTGFFKDKYGGFTLGMVVDVFSLPWTSSDTTDDRCDSEGLIKPVTVTCGSTNKYAYKPLKKGDTCTLISGANTGYKSWKYVNNRYVESDEETILSGLSSFTWIESLTMSQVNKHLKEASLYSQTLGTPFVYDSNYSYQVEITSYGVKIDSTKDTDSEEYTYGGQQIQLRIADVKPRWDRESSPTKLSDEVEVLATCPRKIVIYSTDDDGNDTSTYITPIGSDMLTFMIYGWNATPNVSKDDGALSYSLGIQNSSSILRSTNAVNVDAVSNATAAAYSLNRVSSKIANQLDRTDITPATPYIWSDTMYVKE